MLLFTQYKAILDLPLTAVSLSHCNTCQDVCVHQSQTRFSCSDFKQTQSAHKTTIFVEKNLESLCYEQKHMSVLI